MFVLLLIILVWKQMQLSHNYLMFSDIKLTSEMNLQNIVIKTNRLYIFAVIL